MLHRIRWMSAIILAASLALLAACGPEAPTNAGTLGTDVPTIDLPTVGQATTEPTIELPTLEATVSIPTTEATTGLSSTPIPTTEATTGLSSTSTTGTATTGTATTGTAMTSETDLSLAAEDVELAYTETSLSAPAGEEISVTFNNNSNALQHNWVLVRGGDDVAEQVDQAAVQNASGNFSPPTNSPDVIAATAMLNPGESETVTFTVDDPGTYTFLCTFPGHYQAGMKGTLTVQ